MEQEDPIAAVADLTGGSMADLVIEAVGHEHQALNLCIDLCRRQGRIHYFGMAPQLIDGIRWRDLFFKTAGATAPPWWNVRSARVFTCGFGDGADQG